MTALPSFPDLPAPRRVRPRLYGHAWLVFVLLTVLALVLSWPLVIHLADRLPGTATWAFDESTFAWNIWYFKYALLDLHTSPLHSELIWYPLGIDLILYTYNFFNALIALPLQLAFNVPLASNLTLLLATALSGLGAYLLTYYVLCTTYSSGAGPVTEDVTPVASRSVPPGPSARSLRLAAFLAAVIYAFASNRAIYAALGHYDMVATQWLPFYALYLIKVLRESQLKNAVLAGLFFALAALAEMIFASFLALLSVVMLLALWRDLKPRRAALSRLILAAGVAALIWGPALIPIAREFVRGDYALTGWGESLKLSTDLVGLVTPTELNPLFNGDAGASPGASWQAALRAVEEGKGPFSDINTVFLGWVTLALALLGAWLGRRKLKPWIWAGITFGLLALGPLLQINGRYRFSLDDLLPEGVTFPLPFALLHYLPFINANRAPNRNSVILMLALAVLAGYGAWRLITRISQPVNRRNIAPGNAQYAVSRNIPVGRITSFLIYSSACVLAALIILEHLALPLPTTDASIPAVYRQIAQEPGEFAIMQLPLGWRNSFGALGSEQTQLQYYQTAHGKRIVGGNISRAPDYKMAYFGRIPLFQALTGLEAYREPTPQIDAAAREQAAALMALYDVRYFVTTPATPGRYPYQDTWQRTEQYALDALPLEKPALWEQDGYRVYRVVQPALPAIFRVDIGAAGAEPYLGQGWDVRIDEQPYQASANWVTGAVADLYLPLSEPQDATLRLAVAPLSYEGAPAQTVSFSVNGSEVLPSQALTSGWQTVAVRVPAAATRRGPNRVSLEFAWAVSPRTAFPDPTSRAMVGATGLASPVNLDIHSFSEAFATATDAIGASTDLSTGRRGYNVAVLHPRTGRLLDQRGFDTAANTYEADALAAYLAAIPRGRIVVLATKGDASAYLTPAAVAALRNVGSRVADTADLVGMAHALVGVQGAAPGAAAEAIAPVDAFLRVSGDFRRLAAAVDWVELDAGN